MILLFSMITFLKQAVSANQKGPLSRSYSSPFEHSKSSKAAFPANMTAPTSNGRSPKASAKSSRDKTINSKKETMRSPISNSAANKVPTIINGSLSINGQNIIGGNATSPQK